MNKDDPEFAKLQAEWYKKLTDSGFVDIEKGKDLNMIPASTMPGNHQTLDWFLTMEETESDQDTDRTDYDMCGIQTKSLVNSDKAVFWRVVQDKVNHLKEPNEYKQFLLDLCESGNVAATARDYGYTMPQGRDIFNKFLIKAGFFVGRGRSFTKRDHEPEPGPCKHLTKEEIAKLDLVPPSQIKEGTDL